MALERSDYKRLERLVKLKLNSVSIDSPQYIEYKDLRQKVSTMIVKTPEGKE